MNDTRFVSPFHILCVLLLATLPLAGCSDSLTAPEAPATPSAVDAAQTQPQAQANGQFLSRRYRGATGSRDYRLYVPAGYDGSTERPLVVMLHGCTQSASGFAGETRMNEVAEANTFLVAYPDQTSSANQNECWNWFETRSQRRGSGEAAIIAGIANRVTSNYEIDAARRYVGGFSAGAAMAAIIGATYPDVFDAVAVHSGLEYKAATSLTGAFTAQNSGGPDPNRQGRLAYQAMGSYAQPVRTIVFHGQADYIVAPVNGDQVAAQYTQTNDYVDDGQDNDSVDNQADRTENGTSAGGRSFTRFVFEDAAGEPIVEQWKIQGMGHAWAGGAQGGSYTDPSAPSASEEIWRFFSATTDGGGDDPPPPPGDDTTPPALSITPPGGTYDGSVTVTLQLDEDGTIYYTTDGTDPTQSSTRGSFDTAGTLTFTAGAELRAYGVDEAGNASPVQAESYIVESAPETETLVLTSIGSEDGTVSSGGFSLTTDVYAGDAGSSSYRGLLSFDTAALPAGAVVESVELRLTYAQAPLGTPWGGELGALTADVRDGCFSGSCAVANADFDASATASDAVTFSQPAGSSAGTTLAGAMEASAFGALNRNGRTQFRVHFENLTSGDYLVDYLALAGGESYQPGSRPVLEVTYSQP